MRTNIVLDDDLATEAMNLSGARTKREVVDLALHELVDHYRLHQLKQLKGQDLIDPGYDFRQVRGAMSRGSG